MPHVVVINPNSSPEITAGIQESLDQNAHRLGVTAAAVTSYGGPRAIETEQDALAAVAPLLATAGQHRADAYVVGCFSDTGLDELRAAAPVPVVGIAESALVSAMAHSRRIGVVSTLPMATFRHELYWARLGVSGRVVADLAIGRSGFDLASREAANDVLSVSRELVSRRGADAVILGSTGMERLRGPLADELGVPVIEPVTAGLAMAVQALAHAPQARAPRSEPRPEPRPEPRREPQYTPEPAYQPSYRAEPSYRSEPSYRAEPSYRSEPEYEPRYDPRRDREPRYEPRPDRGDYRYDSRRSSSEVYQ